MSNSRSNPLEGLLSNNDASYDSDSMDSVDSDNLMVDSTQLGGGPDDKAQFEYKLALINEDGEILDPADAGGVMVYKQAQRLISSMAETFKIIRSHDFTMVPTGDEVEPVVRIIASDTVMRLFKKYVNKEIEDGNGIKFGDKTYDIELIDDVDLYKYQVKIVFLHLDTGKLVAYYDPDNHPRHESFAPNQYKLYRKAKAQVNVKLSQFYLKHLELFEVNTEDITLPESSGSEKSIVIDPSGYITISTRRDLLELMVNNFNKSSVNNKYITDGNDNEYIVVMQLIQEGDN